MSVSQKWTAKSRCVFARTVRVHGSPARLWFLSNTLPELLLSRIVLRGLELPFKNQWGLGDMSSYATYCQDQATDCARRARLARSPDIVAYYQGLELRWLSLAEHAEEGAAAVDSHASEAKDTSRRWGGRDRTLRCPWVIFPRCTDVRKRVVAPRLFTTYRDHVRYIPNARLGARSRRTYVGGAEKVRPGAHRDAGRIDAARSR